jgi:hypothetical protein
LERDQAMSVLRDAIGEAMRVKFDESPSIKSKMDDVAEAAAWLAGAENALDCSPGPE